MAQIILVQVSSLLIDAENPRLTQPNASQREVIRASAAHQGNKLIILAGDIVNHGLNPSDLPIIRAIKGGRYVVWEGNRRLTALKALENPDTLAGAVTPKVLRQLRDLSRRYREAPIEEVLCAMMPAEEAHHWMRIRHTGENRGAGIVPWNSDDSERFKVRTGNEKEGLHTQVLNFLQSSGHIDAEKRSKIPATSLRRLLGTPYVRSRLGIDSKTGLLHIKADTDRVVTALLYVIDDLVAENGTKTEHIYTSEKRKEYAKGLPPSIAVTETWDVGVPASEVEVGSAKRSHRKARKKPPRKPTTLISRDCTLEISDQRIREIETELRHLNIEDYPNAISVLFRVFIELSADAYCNDQSITQSPKKETLANKLKTVADDLVRRGKLSRQQAKPVHHARQPNSLLGPSITLWHDYVHNQYVYPGPNDLRSQWKSLQPFVSAIWAP